MKPKKDAAFMAASAVYNLGVMASGLERIADSLYTLATKPKGNVHIDNSVHYHIYDNRNIMLHGYQAKDALGTEMTSLPRRRK